MDNDNERDEFMDLYMMGAFDETKKKPSNTGGGCLTSIMLIVALPILTIVGVAMSLS